MLHGILARLGASTPSAIPGDRLRAAAVAVTVLLVIALHVVLGEQVPKRLATGSTGSWVARLTFRPLQLFAVLLRPILWFLDGLIGAIARLFGLPHAGLHPLVHTSEEIRQLVARSSEEGVMEEDEREMIHGIFEFSDTVAREVMTPRTDIVAIPAEASLEQVIEIVTEEGHSRLPVYAETIDTIVGVLLVKDLLPILRYGRAGWPAGGVRALMRDPYFVPDTKPVDDLLAEFRQQSVHLAVVLDEFGGTYGLVTMEDLLEEIVGEINDEYDVAEPDFAPTPEGDLLIDGGTSISEVNERCGTALPEEDFDTIGGFLFGALGRVPVIGDAVPIPGPAGEMELRVEQTEDRRIISVRLARSLPVAESVAPEV